MKKHLRSYAEIAAELGITLCPGPCDVMGEYHHYKGGVDGEGTVHWHRERMQRAGLYEFLKLCWIVAPSFYSINASLPKWKQIYRQSTYAVLTAREMGIAIPAVVARNDRLRVRTQMPALPSTDPVYKWVHKENA